LERLDTGVSDIGKQGLLPKLWGIQANSSETEGDKTAKEEKEET
jgi:hypothetical protein